MATAVTVATTTVAMATQTHVTLSAVGRSRETYAGGGWPPVSGGSLQVSLGRLPTLDTCAWFDLFTVVMIRKYDVLQFVKKNKNL